MGQEGLQGDAYDRAVRRSIDAHVLHEVRRHRRIYGVGVAVLAVVWVLGAVVTDLNMAWLLAIIAPWTLGLLVAEAHLRRSHRPLAAPRGEQPSDTNP